MKYFRQIIDEMMNKKQLKMIADVVARNEGRRKRLGTKPKRGDFIVTIRGQQYEIDSVNKGVVYANTGTIERYVVAISDLTSDHNQNLWIEKF